MMKKYCLLALLVGMQSLPVLADTNLNISGNVVASPCTVDTDTVNKVVDLGSIQRLDLQSAGASGDWTEFSLLLTNCPVGTSNVTATFNGYPDSQDATAWKNSGDATNVALRLTQQDHTTVLSNGSQQQTSVNSSTKSATFPLSAKIFTPSGSVGAGQFSSVINVEFTWQ